MNLRSNIVGAMAVALVVATSFGNAAQIRPADEFSSRATEFRAGRRVAKASPVGGKEKSGDQNNAQPSTTVSNPHRDAVGLTLFRRAADGSARRVDPGTRFVDGDAIRLVVESNFDGYLYIFNSDSNGAKPVLIFPQVRLSGGANRIAAHVPTEVPSRAEERPANRWLELAGGPVTDRLVVVVAAAPLLWVPVGPDLLRHCGANRDCYWTPDTPSAIGAAQELEAKPDAPVSSSESAGQRMSDRENEAIARTVRLLADAPLPSAIVVASGNEARRVVAVLSLFHSAGG